MNKKRRRRHVLTEKILNDISAQLDASPKKLFHYLTLHCGVPKALILYVFLKLAVSNLLTTHNLRFSLMNSLHQVTLWTV
jgi:hypothetical protein